MLVKFWEEMQPHAPWEKYTVCGCQVTLIGFNFILLSLSVANLKKGRGEKKPAAGGGGMAMEGSHAIATVTINKKNNMSIGDDVAIAANTRSRSKLA